MRIVDAHHHLWDLQRALLTHLETVWQEPDEGLWEVRGPRRQFTLDALRKRWRNRGRGSRG